jgi:excisionase family DNA binding protein
VVPSAFQEEGLSIKQAAEHLGISEKTVRNWIKEGKLTAHKVQTPHNHQWRIFLDDAVPSPTVVPSASHMVPSGKQVISNASQVVPSAEVEATRLMLINENLQSDLEQKNVQLGFALGQLAMLSAELTKAREEIERLKAPKQIYVEHEPAPEPAAEPERVSWWRRLFGQ